MEALIKIQSELKSPKKNRNAFGGYNYRSCEDILEAVKPICHRMNCYILLSDDIEVHADRVYVKATATLFNAEGKSISCSALAREELTKKGMDAAQITGAASSYARKYALNGLLAIDDTRDPDCENNTDSSSKPTAPAQPRKKITDATLDDRATCDSLLAYSTRDYNRSADKASYNAAKRLALNYDIAEDVMQRYNEIFKHHLANK